MKLSVHINSMRYPDQDTDLIRDLTLDVPSKIFISLLGRTGIGKTTLLRIIAGLEQRYDGVVELGDEPLRKPCRDIQIVTQDKRLLPWKTVAENIKFAVPSHSNESADRIAHSWLGRVGLDGKATSWPRNLSGGETARVAFAQVVAGSPEVLLLDEPFSDVDVKVRYKLHQELEKALRTSPKTVVLVTHNVEDAVLLSDTVYVAPSSPLGALRPWEISLSKPRRFTDPAVAEVVTEIVNFMLEHSKAPGDL